MCICIYEPGFRNPPPSPPLGWEAPPPPPVGKGPGPRRRMVDTSSMIMVGQVGSKLGQVGAKMSHVGAKLAQVGAKVAQVGAKMEPTGTSRGIVWRFQGIFKFVSIFQPNLDRFFMVF